ncbi:MAG: hypothetical protein ACKO50_00465, partial [Cyanobium sp.]
TIAQTNNGSNSPQATLPVRIFGNNNNDGMDYITVYVNETLMNTNYNQPLFTDSFKWAIIA